MKPERSTTDPIEAIVCRARSGAEAIFRRHGVSVDDARRILRTAVQWLESPQGLVPGAGHRLVKSIKAASRQFRVESRGLPVTTDYGPAFADLIETVRRRRSESEEARKACVEWIPWLEEAALTGTEDLAADPRLRVSKDLVGVLIDHARERWKSDPARSLAVAKLSLSLLDRLRSDSVNGRFLADLEARGHTYAGNAHRLLGDHRSAERELEAAQAALARGTQDPRERAQMLLYLASLSRDKRHFAEALRQLQQAAAIYRWTRERHAEGMIYMLMATTHAYAGNPDLALPLAAHARELLDSESDPRLTAGLEKNVAHYLYAADRPAEARQQIRLARPLVEAHGTPDDLRRLRWIEGQIAVSLGEREEGERLLNEIRAEYVDLGDSYSAALVSLELVAEYLDQGRTADARRLAAESLPIFQSLEIQRETLASLIALQRATELETATAGVVRELLERLRRGSAAPPPRPEKPS